MSKLIKYAKNSTLMDISIKIGDESFKFNLYKELKLPEITNDKDTIETFQSQPQIYGFLAMIKNKLEALKAKLSLEKDKVYAKALMTWKGQTNPYTGRPYNDEYCKAKAETDKSYITLMGELFTVEYNLGVILSCLRAFEARKDLMQTLSANMRIERSKF